MQQGRLEFEGLEFEGLVSQEGKECPGDRVRGVGLVSRRGASALAHARNA